MAHDDSELIARLRAGDSDAVSTLVQRYSTDLYRFAYVWTSDAALAQEIVQDVFMYVWMRRESFNVHGSLKSYLLRAIRNRALDVLKHERSLHRIESSFGEESFASNLSSSSADTTLERDDLVRTIQDALANLPARTREIFLLRREQEMTYAEIAETLGIGLPTIHNQMSRAAKAVQDAITRWRGGE